MIKINCRHCKTTHVLKKEDLLKFKGKNMVIKCKNCQKPISIKINE